MCKTAGCPEEYCVTEAEVRRLYLLQNAVINYGGGIKYLEYKTLDQAKVLIEKDPETAALLMQVSHYLRDVGVCCKFDDYRYEY